MHDDYRISQKVHGVLLNWARWAKSGKWYSTCRSIEHQYAGELGDVWTETNKAIPVEAREAWDVETAWRTKLSIEERVFVKSYYITAPVVTREGKNADAFLIHAKKTCRKVGVQPSEYAKNVYQAANRLFTVYNSRAVRLISRK